MRILLVSMTIDPATGTGIAEKTTGIARALLRAGDRVAILTSGPFPAARREELRDAEIVTLPLVNRRFWIPFPLIGRMGRVRRAVAGADVIVLCNHWMLLNLLAARAARRLGKPTVSIPSGALPVAGRSLRLKRLYNRMGGTRMMRDAAAHVATTAEEVDDFIAYGVPQDRVHVIPNAVELPQRPRTGSQFYPAPSILFAGRLTSKKGPDLLLDAFIRIADRIPHHLVLAGPDMGLLGLLRDMAARAGLAARVHFPGAISPQELAGAYASSSIVVVPSRIDTMTLVVLDAGVHARPLIITDRCGVGSFAEAGAVRLTSADAGSIAAALVEVLTSADQGAAMGRALREHVVAHYAWDTIVERYRELFRRVIG